MTLHEHLLDSQRGTPLVIALSVHSQSMRTARVYIYNLHEPSTRDAVNQSDLGVSKRLYLPQSSSLIEISLHKRLPTLL